MAATIVFKRKQAVAARRVSSASTTSTEDDSALYGPRDSFSETQLSLSDYSAPASRKNSARLLRLFSEEDVNSFSEERADKLPSSPMAERHRRRSQSNSYCFFKAASITDEDDSQSPTQRIVNNRRQRRRRSSTLNAADLQASNWGHDIPPLSQQEKKYLTFPRVHCWPVQKLFNIGGDGLTPDSQKQRSEMIEEYFSTTSAHLLTFNESVRMKLGHLERCQRIRTQGTANSMQKDEEFRLHKAVVEDHIQFLQRMKELQVHHVRELSSFDESNGILLIPESYDQAAHAITQSYERQELLVLAVDAILRRQHQYENK